jgi:predicted permease
MIPLANLGAVAVLAAHSDRGFLSELVRHPLVLSSLAGFAWNLSGLPLPGFADQTLALLGQTALPAGLLSVGAAMKLERGQGPLSRACVVARGEVGRCPGDRAGPRPVDRRERDEAAVLVLCAALPTATNAYILAVRMTGDGRAVALQVTVGTVLSMGRCRSGWLWCKNPRMQLAVPCSGP